MHRVKFKISKKLRKQNKNKLLGASVVLVLVIAGAHLLILTRAQSPYASAEASSGNITSPAIKQACTGSVSSDCVVFGTTCGSTLCANQTASSTPVCGQFAQTNINVAGVQWWRETDNWGGGAVCLNQWDGSTASYLIQSQTASGSGGVLAYPNLDQGYAEGGGGSHTANWTSLQESAIPSTANFSMYTNNTNIAAGTQYDTGADLWFSTTPTFTNRALEVFIALNSTGSWSSSDKVTIDGTSYDFNPYTQGGWVEATFEPEPQQTSVTNLDLVPFFNFLISKGYLTSSEYFVNAGFGNEINAGGTGIQLTGLSLTL